MKTKLIPLCLLAIFTTCILVAISLADGSANSNLKPSIESKAGISVVAAAHTERTKASVIRAIIALPDQVLIEKSIVGEAWPQITDTKVVFKWKSLIYTIILVEKKNADGKNDVSANIVFYSDTPHGSLKDMILIADSGLTGKVDNAAEFGDNKILPSIIMNQGDIRIFTPDNFNAAPEDQKIEVILKWQRRYDDALKNMADFLASTKAGK